MLIYSPLGEIDEIIEVPLTPIPELEHATVVVLDNTKHNFREVMQRVSERMGTTHPDMTWIFERKLGAAVELQVEMEERIRKEADLVVTGSADCGSCTSQSTQDAVLLDQAGTPSILVHTTLFAPLVSAVADRAGSSALRRIEIEHPLGGIAGDDLDLRADQVCAELERYVRREVA